MRLGRNVVVLGIVSLLADVSGDMVMPVLPAFLVTLGAGAAYIGVIEGAAEGTAALLKYLSGRWADRVRNLLPLAMLGYALAGVARPFLALAQKPWHVLAVRNVDRIGKGIRTSPRDKLLASSTTPARLAEAFSFHRGMDHAGAAVGPLLATGMLLLWPGQLRRVFLVAAVPGALAVLALFAIREEPSERAQARAAAAPAARAGAVPVRLLAAIGVFTLGNSTDALLLLRAGALGIRTALLPLLWALLHVMRAALSWPAGRLADRLGRRGVLICGWLWYAACYLGFSLARAPWQVWMLFAAYGLVAALTEGTERALIAAASPPGSRGRALGLYNLVSGVGLLAASVVAGQVWEHASPAAALQLGAALALAAAAVLAAGRQAAAA
ncbi:MAG TPA: MFS transporter [Myxococcales bacterium]|nr:MFS transporter [Myxococcales bacterium]